MHDKSSAPEMSLAWLGSTTVPYECPDRGWMDSCNPNGVMCGLWLDARGVGNRGHYWVKWRIRRALHIRTVTRGKDIRNYGSLGEDLKKASERGL
jgi:hypothetical protein